MRKIRFRFPMPVTLPVAAVVNAAELSLSLGSPSRQLLYLWRTQRDFPQSFPDGKARFALTDEVEKWLIGQGIAVQRM